MSEIMHAATRIREEMHKSIIGQETTIELLLTALFSRGHILLEDVPGTGKTVIAKALASTMGCQFSRIQCTPDLLPGDMVGTMFYNQKESEFVFRQGPIFSQILLVDEINRAVPRTQSALLEAMAEGQVTSDGESRQLQRPFFVIATQNPIESHGTFPLPEAQLDRFQMKISLGYPSPDEEIEIFRRARQGLILHDLKRVVSPGELLTLQESVQSIHIAEDVEAYMLAIVRATRAMDGVLIGASPRSLISLGTAAQALAAIRGRDYVIPDDIKYLAPYVLQHRLVIDSSLRFKQKSEKDIIGDILTKVPVPAENDLQKATAR